MALVLTIALTFAAARAVVSVLAEPTFTCQGTTTAIAENNRTVWDIADTYCSGNITDAAKYIMTTNNLIGEDLKDLRLGSTIVIKGGN